MPPTHHCNSSLSLSLSPRCLCLSRPSRRWARTFTTSAAHCSSSSTCRAVSRHEPSSNQFPQLSLPVIVVIVVPVILVGRTRAPNGSPSIVMPTSTRGANHSTLLMGLRGRQPAGPFPFPWTTAAHHEQNRRLHVNMDCTTAVIE